MFNKTIPAVPYGVSGAYMKDNGQWYVTVTIDNMNSIERLAQPHEIVPPHTADDEAKAKPAKKAKQ